MQNSAKSVKTRNLTKLHLKTHWNSSKNLKNGKSCSVGRNFPEFLVKLFIHIINTNGSCPLFYFQILYIFFLVKKKYISFFLFLPKVKINKRNKNRSRSKHGGFRRKEVPFRTSFEFIFLH